MVNFLPKLSNKQIYKWMRSTYSKYSLSVTKYPRAHSPDFWNFQSHLASIILSHISIPMSKINVRMDVSHECEASELIYMITALKIKNHSQARKHHPQEDLWEKNSFDRLTATDIRSTQACSVVRGKNNLKDYWDEGNEKPLLCPVMLIQHALCYSMHCNTLRNMCLPCWPLT